MSQKSWLTSVPQNITDFLGVLLLGNSGKTLGNLVFQTNYFMWLEYTVSREGWGILNTEDRTRVG